MICPCKDCENKGCGVYHSKCKKYLEWAKWKRSVNEKERKYKDRMFLGIKSFKKNKKY